MIRHCDVDIHTLHRLIKNGKLVMAGNNKLRIYGSLTCTSGKRVKKVNRIFFRSETEAIQKGFRPCGHCLQSKYRDWKTKQEAG